MKLVGVSMRVDVARAEKIGDLRTEPDLNAFERINDKETQLLVENIEGENLVEVCSGNKLVVDMTGRLVLAKIGQCYGPTERIPVGAETIVAYSRETAF